MSQAKGVLPREQDREVLYRNPRTNGYFVWLKLRPDLNREGARAWFEAVSGFVDSLVLREDQGKGDKVAAIAVGLAPSFFTQGGVPRFDPPIDPPAAFRPDPASPLPNTVAPLANAAVIDAEVLFYIASTLESRVSHFIEQLWGTRDTAVQLITLDRGYQRDDDREAFGYLDGLRNVVPRDQRQEVVFVHRDERHLEEPEWANGGTYLAYTKIVQHRDTFAAIDAATQDQIIGRNRHGERLDLAGEDVKARQEPPDIGPGLPENAHVHKAGPRGTRDDCQIFRRGLPFLETGPDGQVRVGLQFCSFQASLDQFDVVFNDWMTNARFPHDSSGLDALLDPNRTLTTFEKAGFYFVPPFDDDGIVASTLFQTPKQHKPRTGRLVIKKRITDPSDASRRFDRRGFRFTILDANNAEVAHAVTDSTGRAVVDHALTIGATYTVREEQPPLPNLPPLAPQTITIERSHQELVLVNQMPPNSPYSN